MTDTHEVRELKFRLKQANASVGRQGRTIHILRAENAELREIQGKIDRGDIRRLEREVTILVEQAQTDHERLECAQQEIARLREKLAGAEGPT